MKIDQRKFALGIIIILAVYLTFQFIYSEDTRLTENVNYWLDKPATDYNLNEYNLALVEKEEGDNWITPSYVLLLVFGCIAFILMILSLFPKKKKETDN